MCRVPVFIDPYPVVPRRVLPIGKPHIVRRQEEFSKSCVWQAMRETTTAGTVSGFGRTPEAAVRDLRQMLRFFDAEPL